MNPIPPLNREQIYQAVFQFWAGLTVGSIEQPVPAFTTSTRNLLNWTSAPPEESPAICVQQFKEVSHYRRGLPIKWTLEIVLYVYVFTAQSTDSAIIVTSLLNPLLDAIEGALAIDDITNNACTLGGLVSSCAINGPIEIFQGDLGDTAVATVPISIVPNH